MFPLSCARVCVRTQVVRQAHARKLGAHINVPFKNGFPHILYMPVQIQINSGKMLHKRNFMCTHTLKKLEGTLVTILI